MKPEINNKRKAVKSTTLWKLNSLLNYQWVEEEIKWGIKIII